MRASPTLFTSPSETWISLRKFQAIYVRYESALSPRAPTVPGQLPLGKPGYSHLFSTSKGHYEAVIANKHVAIVIDWYGPYSLEEAKVATKEYFGEGLYFLIGKIKYPKKPKELQYIGITKDLFTRIGSAHNKISELSQECSLWLGEVASFGIPGSKKKITNAQLDLAEWLHSYFRFLGDICGFKA